MRVEFDVVAASAAEAAAVVQARLDEVLPSAQIGSPGGGAVTGIRGWDASTDASAAGGMPADLLAWQVLRALVAEPEVTLTAVARRALGELLDAADLDVVVPDAAHPDQPPVYGGPASEAHNWLPPGSYPAVGADGAGSLRLLVSAATAITPPASVVFTAASHDATTLHHLSALLEDATPQSAVTVLHEVGSLVARTGRPVGDLDDAATVDAVLRDMLDRRGRELASDAPAEPPPTPPTPGRDL